MEGLGKYVKEWWLVWLARDEYEYTNKRDPVGFLRLPQLTMRLFPTLLGIYCSCPPFKIKVVQQDQHRKFQCDPAWDATWSHRIT
jgi:hypothetical protein